MRELKILLGLVVVATVALAVVGWSMPRHWQVQRSLSVNVPADSLMTWLADLHHWSAWTPWPSSVTYSYAGASSGAGARLHWSDGASSGLVTITAYQPGQRLAYVMHRDNSDSTRQCELVAAYAGAQRQQLLWQCSGVLGANPFDRVLMRFIKPRIERDMQRGLERLAAHFSTRDRPPTQEK